MTIQYKEKTLELKYGIREQMMFQSITKRIYKAESLFDNFMFYYCCISVANKEKIDIEEFADFVDGHIDDFISFMEWLTNDVFVDKK